MEDKKKKLSHSHITGIIAFVFLIIGYQTALFVHNAAVTKIVSNRDQPDTVFVLDSKVAETVLGAGGEKQRTERKKSEHSPEAERIAAEYRKVRSFRFDPNTVSVEDLQLLGFSRKQAESIDNYRKKGGRFRRKSDFAKSFVVSDSVFRRLEPYIDIPLTDLNVADSAALDALPGIGGYFAAKIIEHRNALGGYSHKEQLMDIYRFDREKFDALEDLVEVSERHMQPYALWHLPEDSLKKHPYIGTYAARGIVVFRDNNPSSEWTVDALAAAGILKKENADRLARCILAPP